MIVEIMFKTPDAVEDAVDRQMQYEDFPDEADETYIEGRKERAIEFIERFVKYGELVTIEFDSVKGTARVVPV